MRFTAHMLEELQESFGEGAIAVIELFPAGFDIRVTYGPGSRHQVGKNVHHIDYKSAKPVSDEQMQRAWVRLGRYLHQQHQRFELQRKK